MTKQQAIKYWLGGTDPGEMVLQGDPNVPHAEAIATIGNGLINAAYRDADPQLGEAIGDACKNILWHLGRSQTLTPQMVKEAVAGALSRHSQPFRERVAGILAVAFDELFQA